MTASVFDRGDIVRVRLNPAEGRGLKGDARPCLVLSPRKFNCFGMTLVAPITQRGDFARVQGFTVPLMGTGTETQGVVLVNSVRMMDLAARDARKIETAPADLVGEVLAVLAAVIE